MSLVKTIKKDVDKTSSENCQNNSFQIVENLQIY